METSTPNFCQPLIAQKPTVLCEEHRIVLAAAPVPCGHSQDHRSCVVARNQGDVHAARPPRTTCLFILPSLVWRSEPRRSCEVLRQTAIEQKTRPTPRPQIARKFVAVDMLNRWGPYVRQLTTDRAKRGRGSCG